METNNDTLVELQWRVSTMHVASSHVVLNIKGCSSI
jgi:hypothetical protein